MVPKNRIWIFSVLRLMRPNRVLVRDGMLPIKMKMNVFRTDLLT